VSASVSDIRTAGIIPAAGTSARMGRLKQLVLIEGQTILGRVIKAALDSDLERIVVVLGFGADEIQRVLGELLMHPNLTVVVNRQYRAGLAGSLQAGLKPVMDDYNTVMILLADHPFIESAMINRVLNRFQNSAKDLCLCTHRGRRGHPACLRRRFFPEIMALSGDIGARNIFADHPNQVLEVELESDRYFMDVDTLADLERAASDHYRGQWPP
jgi:molybdenum cofactor cytidylyltransferase